MITATVDIVPLENSFRAAIRAAGDLAPAWRKAKAPARVDLRDHRARNIGPDGPWPARSPFTLQRARSKARKGARQSGKRARRILGKLPTALKMDVSARALTIKSRVKWAAIHQEGGRAGRGSKIPPRPFLWASDRLLETIGRIIMDRVLMVAER